LKLEIALLDLIKLGFWPVIFIMFFSNSSKSLTAFLVAKDQIQIDTITFSTFGTELMFLTHNFFFRAGTVSLLNVSNILMYL
jgi:hypothetical protein